MIIIINNFEELRSLYTKWATKYGILSFGLYYDKFLCVGILGLADIHSYREANFGKRQPNLRLVSQFFFVNQMCNDSCGTIAWQFA